MNVVIPPPVTITVSAAPVAIAVSAAQGPAGPEGPTGAVTNASVNAAIAESPSSSRAALGLGTAATSNTSDFASAAQGTDERVPTAAGLTFKFSTNKATLVDGDKVAILDSEAADAPKHSLFSLVKSTLKTYFDTLYAAVLHTHTAANITDFSSAVASTAAVTANTAKVSNATHTGDATGSGALTVVRIQGVDIPAPVPGDDLKFVRYNHSTGDFDYSNPAGGDALTTNPLSQFAATTSAQLAGVISDETGTGALVFADSPTLVTPALGTPSSGTLTNCTGLPAAGVTGLGTLATQSGTFSGTSSGTNTGDQDLTAYQLEPSEGAFEDGDKAKLDGIEAGADVTDTTNVTAAGALMDSEVTNLAAVKSFDPTDYAAALGAGDNYVTDAEKVVIGNTSGTNSGDLPTNGTSGQALTSDGSGGFGFPVTLGTAATSNMGEFASAAQGATADSATQPGDDLTTLGSGAATDGFVATADGAGGVVWEASASTSETWDYLVANWSTEPTLNAAITGGEVYDYTLSGVTRFRFVPTTYDPTQDAFYGSFDGTTLTGLITTRG